MKYNYQNRKIRVSWEGQSSSPSTCSSKACTSKTARQWSSGPNFRNAFESRLSSRKHLLSYFIKQTYLSSQRCCFPVLPCSRSRPLWGILRTLVGRAHLLWECFELIQIQSFDSTYLKTNLQFYRISDAMPFAGSKPKTGSLSGESAKVNFYSILILWREKWEIKTRIASFSSFASSLHRKRPNWLQKSKCCR